jgi:pimeloyl-ACP methyl ester carboxylesterase
MTGPASRSEALGTPRVAEVPAGRIHVRETGEGPTVVLVHGFAVNGDLWRDLVPLLAPDHHCVTVELPTGGHAEAVDATWRLDAPGMGHILGDVLDVLDLQDVTIVANDSGCAHTQGLITSEHAANDRVARIVFTSGEFLENFPPMLFKPLVWMGRIPFGARVAMTSMRFKLGRNLPIAYGWTQHGPLPDELADSFLAGARSDPAVFADLKRHLLAFDKRDTVRFASRFGEIDKPVLFAWGGDDRIFPVHDAERVVPMFPNARLEVVEGARTFVPLDQPRRLAELVTSFIAST